MKPILFAKDASTFTTNGLGRLDFLTCKITEERNGMFELEGEISDQVYHTSQIEMNSIIAAKVPDQTDLQRFRVYKITKPINGKYTINAQHISYQLSLIPTMPFHIAADTTACASALAGLKSHAVQTCPFNFSTDVNTVSSFGFGVPISIRNALGGVRGSILDKFGGEYLWNNNTVYLKKNRGKTAAQADVILRYGKDITDINQEENIANTITGVVPYWTDTDGQTLITLPEYVVESSYASQYPFKRTVVLDCSQDFETAPSAAALRPHAQAYINSSGIGVPTVSIKVSFINLDQDVGSALQRVKLCDNIGVEFVKLGISTTAKVVKYVYDVLKEKYDSIEVGTIRNSLAQTITDTNGAIETALEKSNWAVKNATAWLTGSNGYVMAVKNDDGTWKELLFMSTNDASDPHANVLRVNENGLGFSSTGVAGPYTQAWTLDGKMVIGGTNVPSLTVYDNQNNILFQIDKNGMEWTATYSEMTKTGAFKATSATLNNATIKGGTLTIVQNVGGTEVEIFKVSADGKLKVQTAQGVSVFEVSPDGVAWNESGTENGVAYSSSMTKKGHLTALRATFNNAEINGGSFSVKDDQQNEVFKIDSIGKLSVKKSNGDVILEADSSGIMWNESGQVSGKNKSSSMTKQGFLTALGALLQDVTIQGGSLYQESNNRYLELANGVIHGGPIGTDFYIYLAYNVNSGGANISCIALDADGIMLDTSSIFMRDSRGGTVYKGAEGVQVVTELPDFDTVQVYDTDGNPVSVVTGFNQNTGSKKDVVHGLIKG